MTILCDLKARKAFAPTVLGVSAFLLLSMGGAILAAPLTVPLLSMITRSRTGWLRSTAVVIAALTVVEAAWAITYVALGEAKPWIWALPLFVGLGTATYLATSGHRRSPCPST